MTAIEGGAKRIKKASLFSKAILTLTKWWYSEDMRNAEVWRHGVHIGMLRDVKVWRPGMTVFRPL